MKKVERLAQQSCSERNGGDNPRERQGAVCEWGGLGRPNTNNFSCFLGNGSKETLIHGSIRLDVMSLWLSLRQCGHQGPQNNTV